MSGQKSFKFFGSNFGKFSRPKIRFEINWPLKKIKISQICTQVKFTLFFVVTCCCNQIVLCTSALQSGNSTKTVKMHPKQIGARVFTESHLMFRSSHFLFLVFGHFWWWSYDSMKILRNLCFHFAREDGQDRKKPERKTRN